MRKEMSEPYVGIDPASETFAASVFYSPSQVKAARTAFENSPEGISAFEAWLQSEEITPEQVHICIENTGVYGETLCYELHARGYRISLLDARSVQKAFSDGQPKTDLLDARKIAEYGFRYADKLKIWQPRSEIVEQVHVILRTREQLVEQKTATRNARFSLSRKPIQTPAANRALEDTIEHLQVQVDALEAELKRLIRSHPTLMKGVGLLLTAPGVGWLLAGHFVVLTQGFSEPPKYRSLAQYLGIAPNDHESGTSVRKIPKSRRYGPRTIRKLLHLAARTLRTHNPSFKQYFLEKTARGKNKTLVLNNIANKLLRRLCAMLRTQTPYVQGHISIDPRFLALA
jgi:transposase